MGLTGGRARGQHGEWLRRPLASPARRMGRREGPARRRAQSCGRARCPLRLRVPGVGGSCVGGSALGTSAPSAHLPWPRAAGLSMVSPVFLVSWGTGPPLPSVGTGCARGGRGQFAPWVLPLLSGWAPGARAGRVSGLARALQCLPSWGTDPPLALAGGAGATGVAGRGGPTARTLGPEETRADTGLSRLCWGEGMFIFSAGFKGCWNCAHEGPQKVEFLTALGVGGLGLVDRSGGGSGGLGCMCVPVCKCARVCACVRAAVCVHAGALGWSPFTWPPWTFPSCSKPSLVFKRIQTLLSDALSASSNLCVPCVSSWALRSS